MFRDRTEAGTRLGAALQHLREFNPVVIAIPRGGLPIGAAVASALDAPLDIALAKKIGHPLNKEFAIGAVSLAQETVDKPQGISKAYLEEEIARLRATLKSRHDLFYRKTNPLPLSGRTVIITDDGIATGNTLMVTVKLIASQNPDKIVVAIPVAPREAALRLEQMDEVDELICLEVPEDFRSVGQYYALFPQLTDEEATAILEDARACRPS